MSYLDNLILHLDMSLPNPVNLAKKTYGSLNGVGTGIDMTNIVDGIAGRKATRYNGSNEYTLITHNTYLNFGSGSFAVGALFRTEVSGVTDCLIAKRIGTLTVDTGYGIYIVANTVVASISDGSFRNFVASSTTVNDGALRFALMVVDANFVYLYLDGELEGTIARTAVNLDNVLDFSIASWSDTGDKLTGVVDGAFVFGSSLTQIQAADLNFQLRSGKL